MEQVRATEGTFNTLNFNEKKIFFADVRNPGRDISFPIFTRKEIETKSIRKEIKTIISRLNHVYLSFPIYSRKEIETRILEWRGNQNKNISFYRLNISFIQHKAGLQLVDFFTNGRPRIY